MAFSHDRYTMNIPGELVSESGEAVRGWGPKDKALPGQRNGRIRDW